MTEEEFIQLYKKLWASNMWRNKDWYIKNKLIQPNGLDKIKHELENLLYGSKDFVLKYTPDNLIQEWESNNKVYINYYNSLLTN
jgi:hypothetical protein